MVNLPLPFTSFVATVAGFSSNCLQTDPLTSVPSIRAATRPALDMAAPPFMAAAFMAEVIFVFCPVWHDGSSCEGPSHEGSCHEGRSCHVRGHRGQGVRLQAVAGEARHRGNKGGEGQRHVHHPWLVHAEDPQQAGDEGWQEGGLREGGHGEGEASIQSGEGLLCGSIEEEHLSRCPAQVLEWTFHSRALGQRLAANVCQVYIARCSVPGKQI